MRNELSPDELSDFIGAIYDCALDPSRWEPTLERVTARLDLCNSAVGIQAMPSGDPLLLVTTGMREDYVARLFDYGAEVIEVFGGIDYMNSIPVGEPVTFSRFGDQSLWETSRYMREWVTPQGIVDCAVITLARDSSTHSSLSLGRHGSAGLIGSLETDALRLLAPHLRRSVLISRVLEARSMVASTFASALDALSGGVILVDSELRVVHANLAGGRLLSAGDPLILASGRLSLRNPATQSALAKAVRDAGVNESGLGGRGLGIPAPRLDGGPSVLHVLPLRHGSMRPGLEPAATAAIFVAPAARASLSEDVVTLLFDLTPAEARVFACLANGDTVAGVAGVLGITGSTVRTHLLRIFAKTGTRRQSELIKLAGSLAAIA